MSKVATIFIISLLFISNSIFAISATDTAEINAKNKLVTFTDVSNLNVNEQAQVYKILLAKEQDVILIRKKHKGDKKSFKTANKAINKKYNRQIKDVIGKERMKKVNHFSKVKRVNNKK